MLETYTTYPNESGRNYVEKAAIGLTTLFTQDMLRLQRDQASCPHNISEDNLRGSCIGEFATYKFVQATCGFVVSYN